MGHPRVKFVLKFTPIVRLASSPCACGVSSLYLYCNLTYRLNHYTYHEILDKPMEDGPIIVALFAQLKEVFSRFGHLIRIDLNLHRAHIGDHLDHALLLPRLD